MTAAVTPAIAMPVAQASRNARSGEASDGAFDDALGAVGPRSGHHATRREMEVTVHRWRQQGREPEVDEATEVPAAKAAAPDAPAGSDISASIDMVDAVGGEEVDSDPVDDETGALEDAVSDDGENDTSLPVQLRAQHAISAMMAIAPARRQDESDAAQSGKTADQTGSSNSDEPAGTTRHKVLVATRTLTVERTTQASAVTAIGGAQASPDSPSPRTDVVTAAAKDGKAAVEAAKPAGALQPSGPEPKTLATDPKADATPAPMAKADQGGEQSDTGARDEHRSAPQPRRGEAQSAAAKVQVVSQQAAPAPVAVPTPNVTAIVAAIDARQALRPTAGLSLPAQPQPMRSLKLQLHPAELGMVTANLKATGDQLSVELHVENTEAYHRLSADSDAIVKSLRTLGYDIDRVSILQPQLASTGVPRADNATGATPFSRDGSSFQAGNSGNGEGRAGGQASGRGDRGNAQHGEQAQQVRRDRAGSGIYI